MKITPVSLLRCPNCELKSTARAWDERTIESFGSPIVRIEEWSLHSLYTCPQCSWEFEFNEIIRDNPTYLFKTEEAEMTNASLVDLLREE